MPQRSKLPLSALTALVFLWCAVMPFVWAQGLASRFGTTTTELLPFYVPELTTGLLLTLLIPFFRSKAKLSALGLIAIAILGVVLKFIIGSPSNIWPVTTFLLLLLSWQVHRSVVVSTILGAHE